MSYELRRGRTSMRPAALAFAAAAFAAAGYAQAGCSVDVPSHPSTDAAGFVPAVYRPDSGTAGLFVPTSDAYAAPIVGLWKFELLSKNTATHTNPMPDGTLIDFGTMAWHADGTELMNSGIRNPADGDFCQGVWSQVGPLTFSLNHYALAYTNGAYTGPANIRERVTVDPTRSRFGGTFTLTQYLATVTPGHEFDQTTALVTITGTITATRVTMN